MKTAFILPGGSRSGGIKSAVKAANGLLQRGHEVRLLVHKYDASMKNSTIKIGNPNHQNGPNKGVQSVRICWGEST